MYAATLLLTPIIPVNRSRIQPITFPKPSILKPPSLMQPVAPRLDFRAWADDGDADEVGPDDYEMDEDDVEEADNKKDFDVDYDSAVGQGGGDDIEMVDSKSFVYTQGWDPEKTVDYRINEEEFHKICLMDCDFFIRKPPDPENDVYDFREMYVTPPDTDVYSIPKILAPMPQKYIRCAQTDYGRYNVTEPPIDAPRDPLYKSEKEILKIFLTKHYRNRRLGDPEFALDFEEIYVIDSRTKSITRAKVVVTVPEGKDRDRKEDLLVVRDNGDSFKIISSGEQDDPTTVIEEEEWGKTRADLEKHLSKLRDFNISNWF
ncbi:PLASTID TRANSCRIPTIONALLY ACTIVE protein 6, chloroplastic [Andrographis paniculata]|uniref:PLASTID TRANSCRIPTIONALLY ACTIVE protein 6, chloroplastic n=1 Tax=Andrographis paniculata TaxID=175694 RepID=UPI0021E972F3|nr:PLASTID TRANSCRIPTIONALLY ACTIVE protein 6, chloroplastic [Andrographis paniculata]